MVKSASFAIDAPPVVGSILQKHQWPIRVDSAYLPMTGIGELKSISECLKGVDCRPWSP